MASGCYHEKNAKKIDDLMNYKSPLDAFRSGPREKILYVTCVNVNSSEKPDYLAVIDVDDDSKEFCKVIHRVYMPHVGDELHHFGWNHCTGCQATPGNLKRTHLILPTLQSSRVYVVNVAVDPLRPVLEKTLDFKQFGLTFPHNTHCLPNGKVLISTLGDKNEAASGNFAQLDGEKFEFEKKWCDGVPFAYDFWYQPRHNVMIGTSWGPPKVIKSGLNPADLEKYGHFLYFWDWTTRQLEQTIDLGPVEGCMALEVRMCHDPSSFHGYVVTGVGSSLFHFHKTQIYIGGSIIKGGPVTVLEDEFEQPDELIVKGRKIDGGAQMLQLSLDGKRLFVTTSLYSVWDKQFYPNLIKNGGSMLRVNVDLEREKMTVDQNFLVDFGKEPDGPVLAHEMRYPGGDCSSDIFI